VGGDDNAAVLGGEHEREDQQVVSELVIYSYQYNLHRHFRNYLKLFLCAGRRKFLKFIDILQQVDLTEV
jgi:hypothetical protein